MLDLNHPLTKFVFAIANEDGKILSIAKKMTLSSNAVKTGQLVIALDHLQNMRQILAEGWGESKKKAKAIIKLEAEMRHLSGIESTNDFLTDWHGRICTVCKTEIQNLDGYPDMVYCRTCIKVIDSGRDAVHRAFGLWCI
jgi:hypothetical protein